MKGPLRKVRKTEEVRVNYEARNTVCASNIIPRDAIQLEAHTGDASEHPSFACRCAGKVADIYFVSVDWADRERERECVWVSTGIPKTHTCEYVPICHMPLYWDERANDWRLKSSFCLVCDENMLINVLVRVQTREWRSTELRTNIFIKRREETGRERVRDTSGRQLTWNSCWWQMHGGR